MMNKLLIERINKIIVETQGINDELDLFVYGVAKKIEKKLVKPMLSIVNLAMIIMTVS